MLQIRLLGKFDLHLDGRRVTIASRTGQSLFAYLALTAGTPHRREKLAGLIWPEIPDEVARKNLRQELWRIRKTIPRADPSKEDYLLADELAITFNRQSEYWLDAAQLGRPDLDIESLTSNLSLYDGELLPGFYEEWIILERERIQSLFGSRMEVLLNKLVGAERWVSVQEQAERWLAQGNPAEPAYRALMLAYEARGDVAMVSSVYQRCMTDLDEKLGLEPSAETRALYEDLLKGSRGSSGIVKFHQAGTVTFLFTDIEESTNLLEKLGDQYAEVLADHHRIMRAAIQKWNGHEVDTQGDAFFVTFASAMDAVQCTVEAQRNLAAYKWLHGKPLKVRMGLHTGEPLIASTGYVGMDVHRAARIGDAAHGGQVLLSQTTRDLVTDGLPKNIAVRSLGEHRLKDLKFPTPMYQLDIEGLQHEFPPVRTKFTGNEAPTPGEPPFKGLQYFDAMDADLFFGREVLTSKLVSRLRESQFLSVVIGASGSGKSSVVRAGVVPALQQGQALIDGTLPPNDSPDWRIHIMTPTAHPLEALAAALTQASESVTPTATLIEELVQDPRRLGLFLARQTPKRHTLLVLDQFEELFTLCRDEFEREAFIDNLLAAIHQTAGDLTIIMTLRADFYAHLAQYPELRDAVAHHQEYIGPMTNDELHRAIEEPAKRGHWAFEPGLVDLILRDVGDEPGALPLLSHALLETWKRRAGHTLTLKGYADAGGVRGAIAHTAESVYQTLSAEEQVIARNLFLRLTELGEGTEDTRRRASFDELMAQPEKIEEVRLVLNKLTEARLITVGEGTAEVAHEALIREWPTLREWLNQDREGLRLHRNITEATHEWELLEHDPAVLYRGSKLAQAREWAGMNPKVLNASEAAFLGASSQAEQNEIADREAQQKRELEAARKLAETERQASVRLRTRNRVISTIGGIAVLLAGIAFALNRQSNANALIAQNNAQQAQYAQATAQAEAQNRATAEAIAINERNIAQQQSLIASVRELSSEAIANLSNDPERSVMLALEAVNRTYLENKTVLPEAEDALRRAVQTSRVEQTFRGSNGPAYYATYSPDGKLVAAAYDDGTVKIWESGTGKELHSLKASKAGLALAVAFSPDASLLVTGAQDSSTRVWDVPTGKEIRSYAGHKGVVYSVSFSPDGNTIASAGDNGITIAWNVSNGERILQLEEMPKGSTNLGVAFSPDGTKLATASTKDFTEGWGTIWDAASGRKIMTLPTSASAVRSIQFSPDGSLIVTADDARTTNIWDANSGDLLRTIYHNEITSAAVFTPDGTRLISTYGRQITAYDATTGQELFSMSGHTDVVNSISVSPDNIHLVTASMDGTVRIWNITPTNERVSLSNGPRVEHPNGTKLAYSPDGSRLVITNSDPYAEVWEVKSGQQLLRLAGHKDLVFAVAYSSDGAKIATASNDGIAKIWDAATGKELKTLTGHTKSIFGIDFNPDGTRLATASWDGTAKVWDVATGSLLLDLPKQEDWVATIDYSPDGTLIATGNWIGIIKIWDAKTGQLLHTIKGHQNTVRTVVFSPDSNRLASASFDGTAKVWDVKTGEEIMTLAGHTDGVIAIAYSPDGTKIATGSIDKTAKVWDAKTGQELLTLYAPDTLTSVAFSPDGSQLAAGGRDGATRIYYFRIEDVIEIAKSRLTRQWTPEECRKYLHTDTCPAP